MIYRLERFFYYLLLILIPIQLGRHFWPNFSFIQGIRVDYLSPTLYVSDISILLLFLFYGIRKKGRISFFRNWLFLAGLTALLFGIIPAVSKEVVLLGVLKYIELVFVGFYIAREVSKKDMGKMLFVLSLGGAVQLLIAFFQLISQSSIGGAFYYLGERTFSRATPGIALFSFQDQLWLRPYSTFPHPNVMGFYFFTLFFLLAGFFTYHRDTFIRVMTGIAIFLMMCGVILSFSRSLIVLLFLLTPLFLTLNSKERYRKEILITLVSIGILVILLLFSRFTQTTERDFGYRLDLLQIAFNLFIKYPLFGVGIHNFYYHEIFFQKTISPTLLQPVHNTYLLVLSQTGILGIVVGLIFIKKVVIELWRRMQKGAFTSLGMIAVAVFVVGFFDHYLLTLQQGQLMFAIILGLSFSLAKDLELA